MSRRGTDTRFDADGNTADWLLQPVGSRTLRGLLHEPVHDQMAFRCPVP